MLVQNDFLVFFGGVVFRMRFLGPQGSILGSFGPHFEAPGLHFGVILGHILAPEGSNLEPYTSDIYSFRFCSIHKNLPCLIPSLLSVL